jgi:galactose-1-phosphate uridylyltransferase
MNTNQEASANYQTPDMEIPMPNELKNLIDSLISAPNSEDIKKSIIGLMSVIGTQQRRLEEIEYHLSYLTSYTDEVTKESGFESLNEWAARIEKAHNEQKEPDLKIRRKSGIITNLN